MEFNLWNVIKLLFIISASVVVTYSVHKMANHFLNVSLLGILHLLIVGIILDTYIKSMESITYLYTVGLNTEIL
jgi:hypothetical protein